MASVEGIRDDLREAGTYLGALAIADRFDQEVTQGPPVELELAQYVEHLTAKRIAGLVQLLQQGTVDIALARLLGHEVPEVADFGLADAVDAAEALFEPVGVPRQIVVDHQVGALEVDALARRIGRDEDDDLGIVLEGSLRRAPLVTR